MPVPNSSKPSGSKIELLTHKNNRISSTIDIMVHGEQEEKAKKSVRL
jgi:hypothetical protein